MSKVETKMRERYEQRAEKAPGKYRQGAKYQEAKSPTQSGPYRLVLVRRDGQLKIWNRPEAPQTNAMLNTAKRIGALFAIRYWPSKRGWRVLDARVAQCFEMSNGRGGSYAKWVGHRYLTTIFPNEDSAVMAAMALSAA